MTPMDAVRREVEIELTALARRIGSGQMPETITVRVETDRETGMPRAVDCHEERRRRILGGSVAARTKRCESAA